MRIVYKDYIFYVTKNTSTSSSVKMYMSTTKAKTFLGIRYGFQDDEEFCTGRFISIPVHDLLPTDITKAMDRLVNEHSDKLAAWKAATFDVDFSK